MLMAVILALLGLALGALAGESLMPLLTPPANDEMALAVRDAKRGVSAETVNRLLAVFGSGSRGGGPDDLDLDATPVAQLWKSYEIERERSRRLTALLGAAVGVLVGGVFGGG